MVTVLFVTTSVSTGSTSVCAMLQIVATTIKTDKQVSFFIGIIIVAPKLREIGFRLMKRSLYGNAKFT
jgi:hypothetical protein